MLRLFNSLTKRVEDFKPLKPPFVKMYTCGPTVYQFAHIGNFRSFVTADLLVRVLKMNGFDTKYVMNITDVGHLTNDDMGGADTGEDKIEKAAIKEGKTAREVADFYMQAFLSDMKDLNMITPDVMPKATEHIDEQIELIERLQKKGYTYLTNDGVYFDTSKFKGYGEMSSLDKVKEGARVEINQEKKNPRDFALWKFSNVKSPQPPLEKGEFVYGYGQRPASAKGFGEARQMEWDSPWGVGFPGWHLECSAMSMKYLGEQLDIHTGGVDHKEIHHPNEIAQSEGATGKKFVKYWIHTAFMLVAGQKMSKSLGNIYTLYDLEKEGFNPVALRYLYLQTHYRQEMNFTFGALEGAQIAYRKLLFEIAKWGDQNSKIKNQNQDQSLKIYSENDLKLTNEYFDEFVKAANEDLNMAKALGVMWELVKSDLTDEQKIMDIYRMDEVLGLDLRNGVRKYVHEEQVVPKEVKDLMKERNILRNERRFNEADRVRKMIGELGYEVEDSEKGTKVRKRN